MEKLKGKWCINVTSENIEYLKKHLICGAGFHLHQTIFFDENGTGPLRSIFNWNINRDNICLGELFNEISLNELQNMIEGTNGPVYEIY